MKRVQIVLFDDVEELDFAGPYEVFAYLREVHPEACAVQLVSERGGPVRCAKGLRVFADASFAAAAPADVLLVPGGVGARTTQVQNPAMISHLQHAAAQVQVVASVCTGAFLLHAAGLLAGRRVTTHWQRREALAAREDVTVVRERFVDDGRVVTAAGVSAGVDMSLHLVARLWGREIAAEVQTGIEYFPAPPAVGAVQP